MVPGHLKRLSPLCAASMNVQDIKTYFDEKFKILAAKSEAASQVKSRTLKYQGNQHQLDHETKVLLGVRTAEACLKEHDAEGALEELKQVSTIIEKRIKLIRLADRSEHGWKTVNEYLSDDLASDSEDDKKIKKAETEAARKKKAKQENYLKRRAEGPTKHQQGTQPGPARFFQPTPSRFGASYPEGGHFKRFKNSDRCFSCGREGHWRNSCPGRKSSAAPNFGQLAIKSPQDSLL